VPFAVLLHALAVFEKTATVDFERLREDEMNLCLRESVTRGVQFGQMLLEKELVSAVDLFRLLQQNLAKRLLDLFTWRDGTFKVAADRPHVQSPLKVKVPHRGHLAVGPHEDGRLAAAADAAVGADHDRGHVERPAFSLHLAEAVWVGALAAANVLPLIWWSHVEGWAKASLTLYAGRRAPRVDTPRAMRSARG
jgi:hypothetical protein